LSGGGYKEGREKRNGTTGYGKKKDEREAEINPEMGSLKEMGRSDSKQVRPEISVINLLRETGSGKKTAKKGKR